MTKSYDGELKIPLTNPDQVSNYVMKSGVSAGFLDAIAPDKFEDFKQVFRQEIEKQFGKITLVHCYSVLHTRKAGA